MSEIENDATENLNFELVSGEYSRCSSGDGGNNSENDADDIGNLAIASTNGYITSSGLVWNLEPPAKS
ncbi:hypothetical protein Trydic_g1162 [Trypoxylus dichotomus]